MSGALTQSRIAVVGAGLMGHGLAQVFAEAGANTSIHDPVADVLSAVPARVRANLQQLNRDPAAAERIRLCPDLADAVKEADVVIEAAPEDLELKRRLFERLDELASGEAILATNTSVIPVTQIAERTRRRDRVLGTHWWNPPYLIPLVEVVKAAQTSDRTVARTTELLRAAGKEPVHVKRDVPGFVGNRLQHALWREAMALVANEVCDAETVDTVVKQSFGLRLPALGPLENADLIGLDLTLAIHEQVLPHIESTPGPSPYLRELVRDGRLGMKTGEGFRRWRPAEAEAVRSRLTHHLQTITDSTDEPIGAAASSGG